MMVCSPKLKSVVKLHVLTFVSMVLQSTRVGLNYHRAADSS